MSYFHESKNAMKTETNSLFTSVFEEYATELMKERISK